MLEYLVSHNCKKSVVHFKNPAVQKEYVFEKNKTLWMRQGDFEWFMKTNPHFLTKLDERHAEPFGMPQPTGKAADEVLEESISYDFESMTMRELVAFDSEHTEPVLGEKLPNRLAKPELLKAVEERWKLALDGPQDPFEGEQFNKSGDDPEPPGGYRESSVDDE